MLRALVNNSPAAPTQGGSTITQQYVKNYLINVVDRNDPAAQQADRADTHRPQGPRGGARRSELDHSVPKDDILAGYLNVVEFTGSVYGVAAAAHAYFGTTAAQLTVPQAALLAGMVNNPNLYDPYAHPQQARSTAQHGPRRDGRHRLDHGRRRGRGKAAPLGVLPDGPVVPGSTCAGAAPDAGFFCQYAVTTCEQAGLTADQLATGGYTIRTTMDPAASAAAKDAVDANVPTTPERRRQHVRDRRARATTGTRCSPWSPTATSAPTRRPGETRDATSSPTSSNVFGAGSSFKIFTTAAALENGTAGLDTALPNPASDCFTPPGEPDRCYPVHNDGDYPDPISLPTRWPPRRTSRSSGWRRGPACPRCSTWPQRLGLREHPGDQRRRRTRHRPGRPALADPQYNQPQSQYFQDLLSFTLGDSPVSPLEMANVSATIDERRHVVPARPDPVGHRPVRARR